jgi:hypothetical protein
VLRRAALVLLLASGCTADRPVGPSGFVRITVTQVDGAEPPAADAPLPANLGDVEERWSFSAEVLESDGRTLQSDFNGWLRASVVPGSVLRVEGAGGRGRNVQVVGGRAEGEAVVLAIFGPARLWLTDIGYAPAEQGTTPACANAEDDDGDVVVDFPDDPGCAFADDTSEDAGSQLIGVSQPVHYQLPTIGEVQGFGSETPYPRVAIEVKADAPNDIVVTRVSSNGFFVTDLGGAMAGYNHMFAFSFNTPPFMRVCHGLRSLSGTSSEFFGFTEMSFPSWEIGRSSFDPGPACDCDANCKDPPQPCGEPSAPGAMDTGDFCDLGQCHPCRVPEPQLIDNSTLNNPNAMESLESGLVRMEQMRIATKFGAGVPAETMSDVFAFTAEASNCDLNGDGAIDFENLHEAACANQCGADPECTEWSAYAERGNYKVFRQTAVIQVNTGTVGAFDPVKNRGKTIAFVSGTLRNFSGGDLNWTIETRCSEDLVCNFDEACAPEPLPSNVACTTPPTEEDNDAGTN